MNHDITRLRDVIGLGTDIQLRRVPKPIEQALPNWNEAVLQLLAETPNGDSAAVEWQGLGYPATGTNGRYDAESFSSVMAMRLHWLASFVRTLSSQSAHADQHAGLAVAPDPRNVFVVHGRNGQMRDAMFSLLRALGLSPLEWSQLIMATGVASPYIGQILNTGFRMAQAVIVLMTPDDEARLRQPFHSLSDPSHETELTPQARPNVIFEAGMAMGLAPRRTVLVEIGTLRPFSDIAGIHLLRLDGSIASRQGLANRLRVAGCAVDLTGEAWHGAGTFGND